MRTIILFGAMLIANSNNPTVITENSMTLVVLLAVAVVGDIFIEIRKWRKGK